VHRAYSQGSAQGAGAPLPAAGAQGAGLELSLRVIDSTVTGICDGSSPGPGGGHAPLPVGGLAINT